jgi:hypothetical protein
MEVVGQGVGGGDDVVTGLDLDGAAVAVSGSPVALVVFGGRASVSAWLGAGALALSHGLGLGGGAQRGERGLEDLGFAAVLDAQGVQGAIGTRPFGGQLLAVLAA